MGRPPKSVKILEMEGKSHRTKAELEYRKAGEKALLSGVAIKEKSYVKQNPIAHKEFLRIKKLLIAIEKNDALQENIINRYCMIYAECRAMEEQLEVSLATLGRYDMESEKLIDDGTMSFVEYLQLRTEMQKQITTINRQIHTKREMLLRIEKECLMTTAAAMRVVQKTPPPENDNNGGMFG